MAKRVKTHGEVISPKRLFTEQTPDVFVTELRQLISGMNAIHWVWEMFAPLNQGVAAF